MNNFRTLRKTTRRLGAGIALLALTVTPFWAQSQPVVQVPATCNVVVTGTGTGVLAGLGGRVGNGGIVVMPDPFDIAGTGGNFTIVPNGTTGHTWQLLGDLSIQTSGTTVVASGSGLTQNIESFNKNRRPTETNPPSTATLARSKGRIYIQYTVSPCNASINFDVLKRYNNSGGGATYVPPIIGPGCWSPGLPITYSVDPIASDNLGDAIGTDKYYWTVTNGSTPVLFPPTVGAPVTNYISTDGSSISFNTPSPISGTYTITCCYGRANPWDGDVLTTIKTTCVTRTIGGAITTPTFTTAVPNCLNTSTAPSSFTAAVSPLAGLTYSWSYAGSGTPTVVGSGTQGQNVAVSNMNNDPGTLTLTITSSNGCAPAVFTYPVKRNLQPSLVLTTSPSGACVTAPASLTISLPAGATGNTPNWTISAGGATITSGPANSATVTIPVGAAGGEYTVSAANATPCNTAATAKFYVKPAPVFTTAPPCVSVGTPTTFAVSAPGTGIVYNWSAPGYTPSSATGTSVSLTPTATAGNVTVTACTPTAGTCCTPITATVAIDPGAPTITGPACFNVGLPGTATFSIPATAGTITWTVNSGFGTIASGAGTNSIVVNTTGTAGTYTNGVSVSVVTPCGTRVANFTPVVAAPPGMSLGSFVFGSPTREQVFVNLPSTGYSTFSYVWFSWSGGGCGLGTRTVCTACGTGNSITLNTPGTGYWGVDVTSTTTGGCVSTTRLCIPTTHNARMAQAGAVSPGDLDDNKVTLSPNPNGGVFEIGIGKLRSSGDLVMYDTYGKQVFSAPLQKGVNRFDQSTVANGTYFLRITVDGTTTMKKMEVIH